MIILLGIASIFLFISIFMFYRAENLSREISKIKRDLTATSKEKDFFFEVMTNGATIQQSFLSKRYENLSAHYKKQGNANPLEPLYPIISNYTTIFHECARKPNNIKGVVKNACEQAEKGSYKQLERLISQQEKHIKSLWNQAKFNGFVSLVEALVLQQEQTVLASFNEPLDKVS